MLYRPLVDEQTHALLRLVGNDFLCRQRLVAHGLTIEGNITASYNNTLFNDLAVTSE